MTHIPQDLRIRLYWITFLVSVMLLTIGYIQMRPLVVELNDWFGLLAHFPAVYWIGLVLLIVESIVIFLDKETESAFLMLSILGVLGCFLIIIPVMAEVNQRSWITPGTSAILETGYVDVGETLPFPSYRSWPAFHFISGAMMLIADIPDLFGLARYSPILVLPVTVLTIFELGHYLNLSTKKSFLAAYLFLFSFWMPWVYGWGQISISYILYLMLFVLLTTVAYQKRNNIASILTVIAMTITHLLTSFVVTIAIVLNGVVTKKYLPTVIVSVVFALLWYLVFAPAMIEIVAAQISEGLLSFNPLSFLSGSKFAPTTFLNGIVNNVRLAYVLVYSLPVIVAIILLIIRRLKWKGNTALQYCFIWLLAGVPYGLMYISGEMYERAYQYCLLPALLIIVLSFKNRWFLASIMALVSVLFLPAHYGSEALMVTYTSELKGAQYLANDITPEQQTLPDGTILPAYYYSYGYYCWYYNPELMAIANIGYEPWVLEQDTSVFAEVKYIVTSKMQDNVLQYYFGENYVRDWIGENGERLDVLYENGDFTIYQRAY